MADLEVRYERLRKICLIGLWSGIPLIIHSIFMVILEDRFGLQIFNFTKDLWQMTFLLGIFLLTLSFASYEIRNSIQMGDHN